MDVCAYIRTPSHKSAGCDEVETCQGGLTNPFLAGDTGVPICRSTTYQQLFTVGFGGLLLLPPGLSMTF